jgi:hypothetical protein
LSSNSRAPAIASSATARAPRNPDAARASANAVVGSAANAPPIVAGSVPQRTVKSACRTYVYAGGLMK